MCRPSDRARDEPTLPALEYDCDGSDPLPARDRASPDWTGVVVPDTEGEWRVEVVGDGFAEVVVRFVNGFRARCAVDVDTNDARLGDGSMVLGV